MSSSVSYLSPAQLRHVTQPAFSRRIQALEAWAGTDLVDRSSYPTRLTPAGETLFALQVRPDLKDISFSVGEPKAWFIVVRRSN